MIRRYSELVRLPTFVERFNYLKLSGRVGEETFGFDRYLNQMFYRSSRWRSLRNKIIVRDNGCDLGVEERAIASRIIVHHMNPISLDAIEHDDEDLYNPEFLICVSHETHNAIHYGDENLLFKGLVERRPNDTCPWKQKIKMKGEALLWEAFYTLLNK